MKVLSSIKLNRSLLSQILLVFISFAIMVLMSSYFCSQIVNKYIAHYGDEVINASAETIKTYLKGHEITLNDISFVIDGLEYNNSGNAAIRREIESWTNWLSENDERFSDFLYIYGVINDEFIDGSGWDYAADYDPGSRVWYTGAYQDSGEIYYCDPYVDAHTGEYVMTISKLLLNKDNQPYGVIALDVYLSSITDYISHLQLMDSGYGVLLDSERRIIVHPVAEVFGMQIESLPGGGGYQEIAEQLKAGNDISAINYTSILGAKNVGFFKKLFNGWYVELSLSSKVYYNDVVTMRIALSVTGFILALLVCGVLTFMHIAKNRSDAASQIKSSFLANMSHEIRTPMNAVIGMSELLMHETLSERQMGYVNDINSSARSLLSIINDILDLSKIESGKLTLIPVNYDFHALVDNVNSMFRYVAQQKGIEFRLESAEALPRILLGDDVRLRQVLTNLCGNAVKFTEKGFVRLKVYVSGDMLMFEIKDTGIGIRKEDMPKLFNAFMQANTEKTRNIVGTGLGLTISKAFVEMMGGRIMIDSEYGQGTIITVMIPIVTGSEAGIKHEDSKINDLTLYAPSARILLVDDNEFNLKVAHGLMMLLGIDAKVTLSGSEAIGLIKDNDFDLVFMDHMMPDMDGIEATGEIRKLGGKYKELPIIALTANAVHGVKEMFLANGFNGYISKPIDMQELIELLMEWLPKGLIVQRADTDGQARPEDVLHGVFRDTINGIEEINGDIGLNRVSGIESMYLDNLRLFHERLLPECQRLAGCIADNDVGRFSISVHAMKSTLSTIGAMDLSEEALRMETASKNNDFTYCLEKYPEFEAKLLAMDEKLSSLFPEEETLSDRQIGDPAFLREIMETALAAAEGYDNDAGMQALSRLSPYDFGADNERLLQSALRAFQEYDFEGAKHSLGKISL